MAKEVKRSEIICLVDPPINLNLSEEVLEASLAAETSTKKGGQNAGTSLNAKLADLDQALAAKRITRTEHKKLRNKTLARF